MASESQSIPALGDFLSGPVEDVIAVAPQTMVLAGAGTRRDAILHGISAELYPRWIMDRLTEVYERLFNLGVKDLFIPIIRSTQYAEGGDYGRRLWWWAQNELGDARRINRLIQAGIRIRALGAEEMSQVADLVAYVEHATAGGERATLWWLFTATEESAWSRALAAICEAGARTRAAAIRAIYGRDVAPVGVYLGFGKPFFSSELMPPLLEGKAAAFWYQQPGYTPLTERLLRRVFYEAAYLRHTWVKDKTGRYDDVLVHRTIWKQRLVLGFGQRVGKFWYPSMEYTEYEPHLIGSGAQVLDNSE